MASPSEIEAQHPPASASQSTAHLVLLLLLLLTLVYSTLTWYLGLSFPSLSIGEPWRSLLLIFAVVGATTFAAVRLTVAFARPNQREDAYITIGFSAWVVTTVLVVVTVYDRGTDSVCAVVFAWLVGLLLILPTVATIGQIYGPGLLDRIHDMERAMADRQSR